MIFFTSKYFNLTLDIERFKNVKVAKGHKINKLFVLVINNFIFTYLND